MEIEWHRATETGSESLMIDCELDEFYDLIENVPALAAHRLIRNLEACLCAIGEAKEPPVGGSVDSGSASD